MTGYCEDCGNTMCTCPPDNFSWRTGVIIGLPRDSEPSQVIALKSELKQQFPDVEFALITGGSGCTSFSFLYEEGEK